MFVFLNSKVYYKVKQKQRNLAAISEMEQERLLESKKVLKVDVFKITQNALTATLSL